MNGPLRKDKDKSNNLLGSSQQKHRNTSRNPFKGPYKKEMFAISLAILIALLVLLVTHVSTGDNDAVQQTNQSVNQTVEIPTQIYSAGGISFNYPASWNITTDEINGTDTQIVIQDPASASNSQSTQIAAFTVLTEQDPNETLDQYTANFIQSIENSGANIAATNTSSITLNGINANQTIYAGNDGNYNNIQLKMIYFEQNDMFYILAFLTKGMDLESQDQYFNIILNSFKVQ
jgi:hypothetical protein